MASSTSSAGAGETQTYTEMKGGDVEALGAHCQLEYCHVLDFLPFRCESCKGYETASSTFPLNHAKTVTVPTALTIALNMHTNAQKRENGHAIVLQTLPQLQYHRNPRFTIMINNVTRAPARL